MYLLIHVEIIFLLFFHLNLTFYAYADLQVQQQEELQVRRAGIVRGRAHLHTQPIRAQRLSELFPDSASGRVATEEQHVYTKRVCLPGQKFIHAW